MPNQYTTHHPHFCTASGVDEIGAWACHKPSRAKGYCLTHYDRQRLGRPFKRPVERKRQIRYEGHQSCIHCDVVKPLAEFSVQKAMANGHRNICRVCVSAKQCDRYYGVGAWTWKQWKLAENDGCCGWCGTDKPGGCGDWHLHHDHHYAKKDWRGWRNVLCADCNTNEGKYVKGWNALGWIKGLVKEGTLNPADLLALTHQGCP